MLTTAWLSGQLEHQVPLAVLRRALLLGGLAHPDIKAEVPPGPRPVRYFGNVD